MAYKHVIRAKTKNLFDISNADIISKDYCFTPNQGAGSNFYVMTVTPDMTYTVSYERFINSTDTDAPSALELSIQTGTHYTDGTQLFLAIGGGERGVWVKRSGHFTVPSGINQVTFSGLKDRFLYRNFMVQEGSTPTPYTHYNYLQSNKRMIKVNDVCQLVPISDKEDGVSAGVTFTNNHNGTWTLSGTSTAAYSYYNLFRNIPLRQGHIYLKTSFGDISNAYSEINWINKDGAIQWGVNPYTADENSKCDIGILKFQTNVDTVVLGPQLFDLTEMFGAGHEPATVAEFRQRFPNELYPYSPQCWLTSYKSAVVCKTKNLFDINSAVKVSGVSSFSKNGNQITVSHIADYSYISANVLLDTSLVGKTVTFSAYAKTSDKNTAFLRIQWLAPNGLASRSLIESNNVSGQAYQKVSLTGIIPAQPDDEHNMLCLSFYSNGNNVPLPSKLYTVVYTDIQLELGDTATSYVPYQHL